MQVRRARRRPSGRSAGRACWDRLSFGVRARASYLTRRAGQAGGRAAGRALPRRRWGRRGARDRGGAAYTEAALAAAGGPAAGAGGSREVASIPGFDPARAKDPAYRLAFKEERARRNEEALARLDREAGCRVARR